MNRLKRDRGFTLIELLVVVAIIGLLASIVLLNTWGQRRQAHDANIETNMHQARNAANLSYMSNGESYEAVCDESDNTLSNDGDFGNIEKAIIKDNGGVEPPCYESASKDDFAVSSPSAAQEGKHFCIESAGPVLIIDDAITSASCE